MKRLAMVLMLLFFSPLWNGCFSKKDDQKTVEEWNLETKKALSIAEKAKDEVEARNKRTGLTSLAPTRLLNSQKASDEQHAASFLTAAKDFQREGQLKYAVPILKNIVNQYSQTKAAVEATEILGEIEQGAGGEKK